VIGVFGVGQPPDGSPDRNLGRESTGRLSAKAVAKIAPAPRHPLTEEVVLKRGYYLAKPLPSGEWLGVRRFLSSTGIVIVDSFLTWRTRFCYDTPDEAIAAFEAWDGTGDPPGLWLRQLPGDRLGPGAFQDI